MQTRSTENSPGEALYGDTWMEYLEIPGRNMLPSRMCIGMKSLDETSDPFAMKIPLYSFRQENSPEELQVLHMSIRRCLKICL